MDTAQPLLGHTASLARLSRAARADALTHAVLLTGPEAVGKTTLALRMATLLLGAERWPGGLLAHPDFWLEDSDSENVSIERVRPAGKQGPTLQDFLALRPYAGGRRVAVLARAERLTEDAANCLLKTIEEPPAKTHLFLCAAHFERLPTTVLSRCELVVLAPVSATEIVAWLVREHGVAESNAATAAALASGRPGRALRLTLEQGALEAELQAVDRFLSAGGGGIGAALRVAAETAPGPGAEGRERALMTLGAWAAFVRDAACFAVGAPELALWTAYRPALERWAEDVPAPRIAKILERIVLASEAVATYAQPRLAFESLLVDIFAGIYSPPAVEARVAANTAAPNGGAAAGTRGRSRAAAKEPATDAG